LASKSHNGKKTFVLDTSVLLADPGALYKFAEHEVIIPIAVIGELEPSAIIQSWDTLPERPFAHSMICESHMEGWIKRSQSPPKVARSQ